MPTVSFPLSTCLAALIPCAAILAIAVIGYFRAINELLSLIRQEAPAEWDQRSSFKEADGVLRPGGRPYPISLLILGIFAPDISGTRYRQLLRRARIFAVLIALFLPATMIALGLTLQDLPIGAYLTATR